MQLHHMPDPFKLILIYYVNELYTHVHTKETLFFVVFC